MNIKSVVRRQHIRYRFISLLPEKAVVLDIGCGDGHFQTRLREYRQDLQFISVDKCDFSDKFPAKTFHKMDITTEALPISSGTVDAVFCAHVLEHIYPHTLILSEVRRVLKPNGSVYIETPSTRSLFIPSPWIWSRRKGTINFFDDPTHIRPFTRQSLHCIGKEIRLKQIKTGFARNWLYCLLAPMIFVYSIIKNDKQMFATTLWSVTGWCVYLWGKDIES